MRTLVYNGHTIQVSVGLKDKVQERGYSQGEIARTIGKSQQYVACEPNS